MYDKIITKVNKIYEKSTMESARESSILSLISLLKKDNRYDNYSPKVLAFLGFYLSTSPLEYMEEFINFNIPKEVLEELCEKIDDYYEAAHYLDYYQGNYEELSKDLKTLSREELQKKTDFNKYGNFDIGGISI